MFLLNLFNKTSQQSQDEKFDKITFKIDLNQNVPKYEDWSQNDFIQDEELTPNHPLYYEIFPKQQQRFQEYITTQNDTLMGIAMKLDISEKLLRSINNISQSIYPGMRMKLPFGTDLSKLYQAPKEQSSKIKITQILRPSEKGQELINYKYSVFYNAGPTGIIKGTLTINSNYLIFNPALDDQSNVQKYTVQRLLKFNAIVETVDIQDVSYMQIPEMSEEEMPIKSSVVQIMLYRVGNFKIQKKFKQRLKQLKTENKAIASMTFKINDSKQKPANENGKDLVEKVQLIIKKNQENVDQEGEQKNRLTNIPFFDIIHENIEVKNEHQKEEKETGKIIDPNAVLGNLAEVSQVLTNEEFGGLIKSMPVLYQLYSWVKIYGSTRDGKSFNTFLNRCKTVQPAVLLIKEHKGYKFGAFLIQNIQLGKTGRGQMFIFTFRQSLVPEVYMWTGGNQFFVYCEKEVGVGIGMGFKYGIFVKNDLDKGSSATTTTFGNKYMLSKKQDFYIDEVELWGIDMSY